jgi:hypothetical protein
MQHNPGTATISTRRALVKRRMLPGVGQNGSKERMVLSATICAESAAT